MHTVTLAGVMRPTNYAKAQIAKSMYLKGAHFLGAAILVHQRGGYEFVVLHLLCQGVEIILKAALLMKDYDKYQPKLGRPLGHNLEKAAVEAQRAFHLNPMRTSLKVELANLNALYSKHLLRYGTGYDILVDPATVPSDRVLRRIAAVSRLIQREINRPTGVT